MADNHFVKINEALYDDLREYCSANGLKIMAFVNGCLREKLVMEKYGDIPFGTIKTNITVEGDEVNLHTNHTGEQEDFIIPKKEEQVVENFISKITEDVAEAEKSMDEIIENVGGPDKYNELVSECILSEDKKEVVQQNVRKPRKRVLK